MVRTVIGERRLGVLEWYVRRGIGSSFGGPLNGSVYRREVFEEVVRLCQIGAVVETGTFRGNTSEYFASFGLPVFTVEVSPRYFAFAQRRLRRCSNVEVFHGDSRKVLNLLAGRPGLTENRTFFYLDAHWYDDLPLRDEVNLIFENWERAVIMIDDFEVSGDQGYQFDDYGNGRKLSLDYLFNGENVDYSAFFPALPSAGESPPRRGWVVLARDGLMIDRLRTMAKLCEFGCEPSQARRPGAGKDAVGQPPCLVVSNREMPRVAR
jgi:hypothetical protein